MYMRVIAFSAECILLLSCQDIEVSDFGRIHEGKQKPLLCHVSQKKLVQTNLHLLLNCRLQSIVEVTGGLVVDKVDGSPRALEVLHDA